MSTAFSTIRGFIRTILGDTDSECHQYPDDALTQHIRLTLLDFPDAAVVENGETEVFTTDLSAANKALLAYKSAKNIIAPRDDHFSYKTPVLSIVRKGGIRQLHAHIDDKISSVSGGAFALSTDTDLEALINGTERFLDEFSAA